MKRYILLLNILILLPVTLSAGSYGDYTLYSPKNSTKAYLVNLSGTITHTWTFSAGKPTGYSTYLLQGGTIVRTVARSGNYFQGGPICGEVMKVDYNGTVLWDFVYSTTDYCSHHDICPMPNGNVLLIAYERKTATEVSSAGCSQSIEMWPEKIVEIQPSGTTGGTVVWEWHAWDHLCQALYPSKPNYVTSIVQHPELLNINYQTQKDWMHANGIDYNATLDQITFSSHALNEIYVIDHSTTTAQAAGHTGGNSGKGGDLLYRWGNPAAYQASGTTIFNVVHDAHWVPEDCPRANYLSGFNNKGGAGGKTCVDLFYPPYNGYNYDITLGSAYQPSTYNWRHTYSGTPTQDEGNSQQLPNGNTLVCISFSGYIYEIDSNQTVVWSKNVGADITNAFRYTACYVNGMTVTASASPGQVCPGTPVQLTAAPGGGSTYTFSWTSIPAGFTSTLQNPVVTPAETTSYIVTAASGTCSATDTVTVNVISQITVTAAASPEEICLNGSSQLTATPGAPATYTYSWTSIPPGYSSSQQNPVVSPVESTVYIVGITTGGCSSSDSVAVMVNPLPPTPTITLTGDSLMSSVSSGNQWYKDGMTISGATGQYLALAGPGTYQVQVTSQEGCVSAMSDSFVYVGLKELYGNLQVSVYPNPTSGRVTISGSGLDGRSFTVSVFNSMGTEMIIAENDRSPDLSSLESGLYYLVIRTDQSEWAGKKIILIK